MEKARSPLPAVHRKAVFGIASFLLAVFSSKSFVINASMHIGKSAVPASTTDFLWGMFALFLWALFYYTYGVLRLRPRLGALLMGLLFGVANFLATSLFSFDSWSFMGAVNSWADVVFKCLGQALAMATGLALASDRLAAYALGRRQPAPAPAPASEATGFFSRLRRLYQRHTTLLCFALFVLCYLPYVVAFYPGTVIYDMCYMVRDFFGLQPMSTWHSVFTTYVFGSCVWLGRLLGSDNYGTLIYMTGQTLLLAYALARCCAMIRRIGAGKAWQIAALAFFAITPIWGCYCMMIGKDTLYTATLLLFFLQTVALARNRKPSFGPASQWIAYGLTALLTCLWRNNGLYVVLPSAIATVCFVARGKLRLWAAASLGGAVVVALLFQNVLVPALGIIDNSVSGIYSVAFQQTARTVRDHGDELTDAEKTEIDRVLDLSKIGVVYEPWISDPVKDQFRQWSMGGDVEQEALARYRKTWLAMFAKYPVTYLQAFIGNNSGYYAFTPKMEGFTHNQQAGLRFVFSNYWEPDPGQLHTTQPDALAPARKLMMGIAQRWWTLPLLSYLYVFPFYTWLLVGVGLSLARQRRWRDLALMIPALFSFAVCLVSPANDYLRYFLPIIAMTLPLAAYAAHPDTE